MLSPFDFIFRAPFSGNVTQQIAPNVLSPRIKGSAAIEHQVQTEVASFGKQLGKVLEALQVLAAKTDTPLPEIDALVDKVESIKHDAKDRLRAEAADALARLKDADPDAWQSVIRDTP